MRMMYGTAVAALLCCAGTMYSDDMSAPQTAAQSEDQLTVQDVDRQIQMVKEAIDKYNNFVKYFGRKADSLQPRDFSAYRHAAAIRDECKGISNDLSKHLKELEQQRAKMVEQSTKPSK